MSKAACKTIREAWYKFESVCSMTPGCHNLMCLAYDAAAASERQHRRVVGGAYRESVACAARYFVLKWALDVPRKVGTWSDVATTRPDALYGHGLGHLLSQHGRHRKAFPNAKALRALDYVKDIVGKS